MCTYVRGFGADLQVRCEETEAVVVTHANESWLLVRKCYVVDRGPYLLWQALE